MDAVSMLERSLAGTGRIVAGVKAEQLDDPTPCTEWTVRDLLNHIVGGTKMFANAVTGTPFDPATLAGDHLGADAGAAFATAAAASVANFGKPGALEATCRLPIGEVPGQLAATIHMFDAYVHGWDLARATKQDVEFDPELAMASLEFARQMVSPEMRQGIFADPVDVPAGAPTLDQLVAYCGRKP